MAFRWTTTVAACGLALGLAGPASAVVAYQEGTDLSDNHLSPTLVTIVSPGPNQVIGTLTATPTDNSPPAGIPNRDYFTITIPDGYTLQSLILTNFSTTLGSAAFLGLASGSTAPDPATPNATLPGLLVGYTHLRSSQVATDILPLIGHAAGSPGFPQTLVAGTYTFWLQDTSANETVGTLDEYTLTLNVAAPEPASLALMAVSLAGLGWARRRRG